MNDDVIQVDINKIKIEDRARLKTIDENALAELAESIKLHGCLTPILVKKVGDDYIIIAGVRRWRAAQMAGLETVPVVLGSFSDS